MKNFRRSLEFLSSYKWLAIGAFIMMNVVTFCSLVIPQFIQQIIDDGIYPRNLEIIKKVSLFLLLITILKGVASFLDTYWAQKASQGIAFQIRNQVFKKLEYLEFSFHDKHNIGQLLTRATNDVEAVRDFYGTGLLQMFSALFTLIGTIIILVNTQLKLFLSIVAMIPILIVIFLIIFKRLGPIFKSIQQKLGQLNNILQENILGIRIVKGYTAEKYEHEKYSSQNQSIYNENIRMIKTFASGFPVVFFISNLATAVVIWYGGNIVIDGEMSVGSLVAFNSYLTFLVQPVLQLGMVLQQSARATASSDRIYSIIDAENSIKNVSNPVLLSDEKGGQIEFKNVYFSYLDEEENNYILKDISISIPSGKNTAIIGATGSGKSTLVNLIPRFYDATEGEILINGQNVKNYDLENLRQHIGVVLQEIRLLNSTIRENIVYGKPNASEEEILRVCSIAQVDDFIGNYPEGLDFNVGEGGKNLSGGQRQRVAIARMLLVEPKILILDDATSALDSNTENELIKDASPYLNSDLYTVVVISQNLSTIQKADNIIMLENGEVVAQGNHETLMQNSRVYYNLIEKQNN